MDGPDDARPLSGKGEKQSRRLGSFLASVGFSPTRSSARRSCGRARPPRSSPTSSDASVAIDDRLAFGLDAVAVEAILFDAGEPDEPVLVGHDPDFSEPERRG